MKQKFLLCRHCGNLVTQLRDCGVPVYCCGEPMQELIPGAADAALEKHVPVYQTEGNQVTVTVSTVEHPMTPEHYIEWICLQTKQGSQYRKLEPSDPPRARFTLWEKDEAEAVYAFCNLHSLWKA